MMERVDNTADDIEICKEIVDAKKQVTLMGKTILWYYIIGSLLMIAYILNLGLISKKTPIDLTTVICNIYYSTFDIGSHKSEV